MQTTETTDSRKAIVFWLITFLYMGVIFYLSSKNLDLPKLPTNSDKIVHAVIYLLLAFLFYLSLKKSGIRKYAFLAAVLLAGLYGITDEFHQSFVPGRNSSLGDVFADFTGAVLGSFGASFFERSRFLI